MKREIALFDPFSSWCDRQQSLFFAQQNGLDVAVAAGLLKGCLPYIRLSTATAVVDLPHGSSTTPVRLHSLLESANLGIGRIDVVANVGLAVNDQWNDFIEDMRTCVVACTRRGIDLGVVVDQRVIPDTDRLQSLLSVLKKLGISRVVIGSGMFADDVYDDILLAKQLSNADFTTIICSSSLSAKTLEIAEKVVSGVRLLSNSWLMT